MNADQRRFSNRIEDFRLDVPDAALRRLWLRLGRARQLGEVWEASAEYGVAPQQLSGLLDYWLDDFDFREVEARLNTLELAQLRQGQLRTPFAQRCSSEAFALPLLLLSASAPGLSGLLDALAEPRQLGAPAFHVVCPLELGCDSDPGARAESCAALMAELGYSRYVVHGSAGGAVVAQALASLDAEHVAAVHVTRLLAFPSEDPCELASLTSSEKSQLARLGDWYEQARFNQPESALERLAWTLAQLADATERAGRGSWGFSVDQLLLQLTLRELGEACPEALPSSRSRSAPASRAPFALSCFPLDAPTLRRFAEREQRVLSWTEHAAGGAFPELEQPELLLSELRQWFGRFL